MVASDFDAARDRIILGRREGSNVLLPEKKHTVAVHEAGHALVALLSEHADPVAKVTILPAGQTLGVTEQLPLVVRHMYGEDYLLDSLVVRLGGRAAEIVVLGQGSTGAGNDLAGATDLATKMVREFGMSATLGPVGYPDGGVGVPRRWRAQRVQPAVRGGIYRLARTSAATASPSGPLTIGAPRNPGDDVTRTCLRTWRRDVIAGGLRWWPVCRSRGAGD